MKLILFVLKNKEEGVEKKEGEGAARKPIRETFFGSAGIRVSSQTASPLAGPMRGPKTPPATARFHQTLVRLTTRRSGDIAPVTEKGCLKFLYLPRSEHEHMDIVIIGGGIGGLTLALSLHLRGIPRRVYESAPEGEELGVGITPLPHRMRELTALGPPQALATHPAHN